MKTKQSDIHPNASTGYARRSGRGSALRAAISAAVLFPLLLMPFLFFHGESAAKEKRYILDITDIKTVGFPDIDLRLYFRNEDGESENSLSADNFVLNENRVRQNISVSRITQTVSVAVIIDSSLAAGLYGNAAKRVIDEASGYLESLDKMAVFTFSPEMCAADFYSDRKHLGSASDQALDYSRTPDDLLLYAAGKLADQLGKKHIIYVTASPFFINEAVMEQLRAFDEESRPSLNFLKLKKPEEIIDSGFFGSAASSAAVSTGGVYREADLKDAPAGMGAIMGVIKSNYKLDYLSSQPYSNGRKRTIDISASFRDTLTTKEIEYSVDFNMAELNFGMGDNPVYYQEIDPEMLEKGSELGLTLSASVKFVNNKAVSPEATALIGFGAFRVNGKPEELCHYIVSLDNLFNLTAAKYRFSGTLADDYLRYPARHIDAKEKIEIQYKDRQFFTSAPANAFVKKAGIFWSPFFREGKFNQWTRVFISFMPDKLVFDGTLRYAIYLAARSADGVERDLAFDGVQLQYGFGPTVFTENKTIYLGPEDVQKPMVQPLNPRIEYQMK